MFFVISQENVYVLPFSKDSENLPRFIQHPSNTLSSTCIRQRLQKFKYRTAFTTEKTLQHAEEQVMAPSRGEFGGSLKHLPT